MRWGTRGDDPDLEAGKGGMEGGQKFMTDPTQERVFLSLPGARTDEETGEPVSVFDTVRESRDYFSGKSLDRAAAGATVASVGLGFTTVALRHIAHDLQILLSFKCKENGRIRKNYKGRARAGTHLLFLLVSAGGGAALPYVIDPLGTGLQSLFSFIPNETVAFGFGVAICASTASGMAAWISKKTADLFYRVTPYKNPLFQFSDQKVEHLLAHPKTVFLNEAHLRDTIDALKREYVRLHNFTFYFGKARREFEVMHVVEELKNYNFLPLHEYLVKQRAALDSKLFYFTYKHQRPMIPTILESLVFIRGIKDKLKNIGKSSKKSKEESSEAEETERVVLEEKLQAVEYVLGLQHELNQTYHTHAGQWHSMGDLKPGDTARQPKKVQDWTQRLFMWGKLQSQCDKKLKQKKAMDYIRRPIPVLTR